MSIATYRSRVDFVFGGDYFDSSQERYNFQKDITEYKFKAWDEVVTNNWLEHPEKKHYAFSLLKDPTIYSYAFFRNNDGTPVRMFPFQDVILNDPHKRILFTAANQIGKSFCLCVMAIHFALMNPGTTTLMTSKTFTQSKELLLQIKNILNLGVLDYKFSVGETETKTEIYFKHFDEVQEFDDEGKEVYKTVELKESRIICVPATGAALGYAVDLLLEDELFFYEDGVYFHFQIAQPRTYATKGKIVIFSNPNGQQGVGWTLYNAPEYNKYRFNFLDRPGNTMEEYEALRKSLTRETFDSTVNAVFTSPEGSFLSFEERRRIQKDRSNYLPFPVTQPLYVFFDFAKSRDRTVRGIGVPIEKSVGVVSVYVYELKEYPPGTGYNVIVDDLKNLILEVGQQNISVVGWDNTGVGRGVEDFINQIQEVGISCTPVEFSGENKSRLYTAFKFLVEQDRIDIPFIDECDKQLSKLVFKKSSRGYLMVHHENESDRDDFCFVAGTKVLTNKGQVNIEKLRIGDLVMTRKGYKPIIGVGKREKKVISNIGLIGTPDHPVFTSKGIEKLINVNVSHKLYTWNEKQSSIKESNITDILNQKEDNIEITTGLTRIETKLQSLYTEYYGQKFMEQYLKDLSSIIKMKIPSITKLKILNYFLFQNIENYTHRQKNLKNSLRKTWINTQNQKLKNGINQKKEENGIKFTLKKLFNNISKVASVNNVEKNILETHVERQDFVQKYVEEEIMIKREVYNISVLGENEFFANNILVHNCDSIAGLCNLVIGTDNPPVTLTIV